MAAVSAKAGAKLLFFFTFFSTVTIGWQDQLQVKAIDSPTDEEIFHFQQQRELEPDMFSAPSTHHHHHMGDMPRFRLDTAILKVNTSLDFPVQIWAVSAECYKCNMSFITDVDPTTPTEPLLMQTSFSTHISIIKDNHDGTNVSICSYDKVFGERGVYQMHININGPDGPVSENKYDCPVFADQDPVDSYIPILVAFCIYVGIILIFLASRQLYFTIGRSKYAWFIGYFPFRETDRLVNSDLGAPSASSTSPEDSRQPIQNHTKDKPSPGGMRRLRSLDTFRGFSLAVMVFVNYGGGGYWFFKHSRWNGLTVADLVFPWFVFIMGTSIALSFRRLLKRGTSRLSLLWKVIERTVILFLLGLFIINTKKGHNSWTTLRIPGVLQRLALTYFIVAVLEVVGASAEDRNWSWKPQGYLSLYLLQTSRMAPVRDIVNYWGEWLIMVLLVTLQLVLTFWLQVPHCPTGYLGPGGLSDMEHYNCTGGAAGYIDRTIFTDDHMYGHPTTMIVYKTEVPFDPEGLLGTLTSALICFLGLQAGKILLTYTQNSARVGRWIGWALATGAIGALLCDGRQNEGWIPVNKNLWSLSFVLVLSCFAFLLLSLCYVVIDVKQWWTGAPFYQVGMNSILVYIGHELCADKLPFQWAAAQTHASQLASDLVGTTLWVLIAVWLHYKKVYLKI